MGLFDDLIPAADAGIPRITVTPGSVEPDARQPRGIRNNNPGNIEDGPFARSIPGYSGSDGRFAKYDTPEAGQGAIESLLQSYGKRGFNTPAAIIGRWAPASDGNPVGNYARYVAEGTGTGLTDQLDMNNPEVRRTVAQRIIQFENGRRQPAAPPPAHSTDFSAQARRSTGLFDDLVPQGQVASPPDAGPPSATSGGQPAPRVAREGMSEPAPPPTGALEAGARGAAMGVTANFYDELRGLMEAGGLNPKDPASLSSLLSGAYKYWTGDEKAAEKYDQTVARERGVTSKAEADQPAASIAGNIAGGVALPLGAAARGATLAERTTQGARVGAAVGGLSGVGAGDDTASRVIGGAAGAGTGAVLGAVAPAAIEGVVQGARGVATPIANAVRGIRDPESEAARRVALGIQRDVAIDPQATQRLTPQEFGASVQSGGPATIMDIGGETTRALARSAANTSPEGRGVLNRTINDRFEGQTARVTGWLNDTFNFPNASAQREAIEQTGRQVNTPAYRTAMQDGAGGVWNGELQRLAGAPAIQQAAREAIPSLSNRSITEGFRAPRQNPLTIGPDGRATLTTTLNGNQIVPDLRFWDQVKKNIDAQIGKAERNADTAKVQELTALNQHLVGTLDQVVPSYQQARAGAAHFFGAENALQAGQNFVMQNFAAADTRRALAHMSPLERQLFQDGFVSRYIETLNKTGDRRSILNQVADNPAAREKLNIALGPQRATELEAGMRAEGIMDLARRAVQGNSTTARQLTELGLAGGTYGIGTGFDIMNPNPSALMSAALVYGAARGRTRINENLSRHVAEMLTSNDPQVLLRGIRTVARNQTLLTSMRNADAAISRVGSQQAPGLPALQAAGIGRADDNQQ